jgi:hypothetical protein
MDEAVRQAAVVADTAVWTTLADALRAAHACGCRECQAQAKRTLRWADRMLAPGSGDDEAARHGAAQGRRS